LEDLSKLILDPEAFIAQTVQQIRQGKKTRPKAIWLETSECFGEVISFLDAEDPNILYWLTELVDCTFYNSIMGNQGEAAIEELMDTINSNEEYLFIISGAIPLAEDGNCTIMGSFQGRELTSAKLVSMGAKKAKMIISVGTCASFGGPTAARPNITQAVSVQEFLNREVINVPGCPANPIWSLDVFAYIVNFGMPELDEEGRPVALYGETIHRNCPRRSYFSKQQFAAKFGEKECMFAIGCRGPVTKTLCPVTRWNDSNNWPIGDNTTCIGCANKGFPDQMEPFVKYLDAKDADKE
jgi:hydrogenase small subunit